MLNVKEIDFLGVFALKIDEKILIFKVRRQTYINKDMSEINSKSIIRMAEVLQIEDNLSTSAKNEIERNSFGRRIKVRLAEDNPTLNSDSAAWAWPLLPKHLQVMPKVGEMVLVFFSALDEKNGNRFYIGPIISQDYYLNHGETYAATSLLQGESTTPLCHPSGNSENDGSYPDSDTIAVQGRGDAAMWLKDEELRLMCGHKPDWKSKTIVERADPGSLRFNKEDLAYIQMKYGKFKQSDGKDFKSVVNIVGDRIHLISHNGAEKESNVTVTDNKELMTDESVQNFASNAQKMVYGDELVAFLNKFRQVFKDHTHHWSNDPQVTVTKDDDFWNKDLNELLCKEIRIA